MAKAFLIILDGGADRPIPELYKRTPLEVACKPLMNRIASEGMCGIMYPIKPGIRPGSDTAHLALFGYDPYKYYTGRGPFEAIGLGMELKPGDIAFRTNLGTIDENYVVIDRRAGRYFTNDEIQEIENIVNKVCNEISNKYGIEIRYKHGVEHRGALMIRGEKLTYKITGNDPHKTGKKLLKIEALEKSNEAEYTAKILNEFLERVSEELKKAEFNKKRIKEGKPPANVLLIRGAGILPEVEPIYKRYKLKSAMIAGIPLIKGIGKVLGFDVIDVPNYRGSKDDDFDKAFEEAVKALQNYDFVVLHVKPTDSMSHDGDYIGKIKIIERVDNAFTKVFDKLPDNTYVIITCDHATPVKVRDHTGDLVPITIWGPDVINDEVNNFAEKPCTKGALGVIYGMDLMNIIGNYLGTIEKFGE